MCNFHTFFTQLRFRARRSHWENLQPTSGLPYSSALCELDSQWSDLTLKNKAMIQMNTLTTDEEVQVLAKRAKNK